MKPNKSANAKKLIVMVIAVVMVLSMIAPVVANAATPNVRTVNEIPRSDTFPLAVYRAVRELFPGEDYGAVRRVDADTFAVRVSGVRMNFKHTGYELVYLDIPGQGNATLDKAGELEETYTFSFDVPKPPNTDYGSEDEGYDFSEVFGETDFSGLFNSSEDESSSSTVETPPASQENSDEWSTNSSSTSSESMPDGFSSTSEIKLTKFAPFADKEYIEAVWGYFIGKRSNDEAARILGLLAAYQPEWSSVSDYAEHYFTAEVNTPSGPVKITILGEGKVSMAEENWAHFEPWRAYKN